MFNSKEKDVVTLACELLCLRRRLASVCRPISHCVPVRMFQSSADFTRLMFVQGVARRSRRLVIRVQSRFHIP